MTELSIIIPTLNEADRIEALILYLCSLSSQLEIIVVDGGSTDQTVKIARRYVRVIRAPRGRGIQMNTGALLARGRILWFLHADCWPHPDSITAMLQVLEDPTVVGGAFQYLLDESGLIYRVTEFFSNRKNHVLKLVYGDMGIFVRRKVFESLGGYREIPLMEDLDFCRRLKSQGRIVILPQQITTSARRWVREGTVKNMVRNWLLQIGWALGIPPEKLSRWYKFS